MALYSGQRGCGCKSVINDSRNVEEGSLFFCIKGAVTDGHKYIPDVVAKGAKVLVVQDEIEAPQMSR